MQRLEPWTVGALQLYKAHCGRGIVGITALYRMSTFFPWGFYMQNIGFSLV
jgi:hypothetical protein